MNGRTQLLRSTYKPQLSIVVYQGDNEREYYLESHTISPEGGVMEGKPLLQETMQGIVDVFFDERKNMVAIKGLMPDNLLSFGLLPGGNYRMMWYRPAEIRVIHFAAQLKLPTNKVWVPPMIYQVNRDSLDVFCFKGAQRPKQESKIYLAPYFNVSDDGDVCLGNARVKMPAEKTYQSLMKYWEDLFWLSEFTHLNGNNKTKTDMQEVWKKLLASKTKLKWTDINELMPYEKKTLKHILK
jgi:PRTRC genetic system protein B